MGKPKNC